MAAQSQFPRRRFKQRVKKNRVGSEGSLSLIESLEFARHDDLKKIKLAHQGRQALAYRLME